MARRSQRSEAGRDIRVGISLDEALRCMALFMVIVQGF